MVDRPHLLMSESPLAAPVPSDPVELAQLATQIVLADLVAGRLTRLVLLTFRGLSVKTWEIAGQTSAMDDLVRAIARLESAQALAFVYPSPVPPGVEGERGYLVAAESASGAADCFVALRGGQPPGGAECQLSYRRIQGAPSRWFGVEPENEVNVWMEGPAGIIAPDEEL